MQSDCCFETVMEAIPKGWNPHRRRLSDAMKILSESQITELKTAFNLLDKNKDGRVNMSEMKTMLHNLGIHIEDCVVEALIKQASERNDGLVSEDEFLGWMASQGEIGGQDDDIMQDLLAAFRVFDKDGNGYITRDELKVAMDVIGEAVTDAQIDEMLKATDIDHDGKINYEEAHKRNRLQYCLWVIIAGVYCLKFEFVKILL